MRNLLLRRALALGLCLVGLTALSRDAEAAHAVKGNFWDRRSMINGNGGCRVPYSEELDTDQVRDTFYQVVNYINIVTPCVWEPRFWWEEDYVAITENDWNPLWFTDLAANSDGKGMVGGRQEIHICHGCNDFQLILHEMGHAMGLLHEHQRPDRHLYLDVFPYYIQGGALSAYSQIYDQTTLGLPYDRWSVMTYSGWSFMDPVAGFYCPLFGCRTMKFKSGGEPAPMQQFTDTDLEGLRRRYPVPKRLTAMHSGKCVEIPGPVDIPGSNVGQTVVDQSDCHEASNEGWLLRWYDNDGLTDYYLIESAHPNARGLCLDVQWGSQDSGAPVWLWPCTGSYAQQWTANLAVTTGGYIRARHSGKCMDVAWNSQDNGATIVQSDCAGTENQIWGLNYRPIAFPPEEDCPPGERSDCQYDPDVRRVICDCRRVP